MKLIFGLFTISMASIFSTNKPPAAPGGRNSGGHQYIADLMQNLNAEASNNLDMAYGPNVKTEQERIDDQAKTNATRSGWQGSNGLITVDEVVDQVTDIQVSPLEIQKFKICVEKFNRQASHAEKDEQMSEVQQWLASPWSKFGSWFCGANYKCWKSYVVVLKNHILPKSYLMVKKCLKKHILPEYRK